MGRENLYQLVIWVRWELFLIFLLLALLTSFLNGYVAGHFPFWQPYALTLSIFLILNTLYHWLRHRLCHVPTIYHTQFMIDVLLISWVLYIQGHSTYMWGLYVPVQFLAIYAFRKKGAIWFLFIWTVGCYGIVNYLQFNQLFEIMPTVSTDQYLYTLSRYLLHWMWTMALLAVVTLLGTQLVGFTRESMERLKGEVIIDPLTKLYNRRYFFHMLNSEAERCRRYDRVFSLMMIDLDNFKKFNDSYGHMEGDILLRAVAEVFRSNIRRSTTNPPYDIDIPCRYGGEEFAIILPELPTKTAEATANRIKNMILYELSKLINQRFHNAPPDYIKVSASIGLACFPVHADNVAGLIHIADRALYEAKKLGKNRVVTVDDMISNPFSDENN